AALVSQEDTQRGKPDPQVFLVAAAKLDVAPTNCVVMEDAVAGVQAAKAGAMKCVAVTFVGHHAPELLKQAGADLVVKTLEEVSAASIERLLGWRGASTRSQAGRGAAHGPEADGRRGVDGWLGGR